MYSLFNRKEQIEERQQMSNAKKFRRTDKNKHRN